MIVLADLPAYSTSSAAMTCRRWVQLETAHRSVLQSKWFVLGPAECPRRGSTRREGGAHLPLFSAAHWPVEDWVRCAKGTEARAPACRENHRLIQWGRSRPKFGQFLLFKFLAFLYSRLIVSGLFSFFRTLLNVVSRVTLVKSGFLKAMSSTRSWHFQLEQFRSTKEQVAKPIGFGMAFLRTKTIGDISKRLRQLSDSVFSVWEN